jgi:hypothetical protein
MSQPRKQTRRSISVQPTVYANLKAYCQANGYSMSSIVERVVKQTIDAAKIGAAKPTKAP